MQLNVEITDVNLQEQLTQYISKKKIEANELLVELLRDFFNKKQEDNIYKLSKEEIKKRLKTLNELRGMSLFPKRLHKELKI